MTSDIFFVIVQKSYIIDIHLKASSSYISNHHYIQKWRLTFVLCFVRKINRWNNRIMSNDCQINFTLFSNHTKTSYDPPPEIFVIKNTGTYLDSNIFIKYYIVQGTNDKVIDLREKLSIKNGFRIRQHKS